MEITKEDLMDAIKNSHLEFGDENDVKKFLEDEIQFYLEKKFGTDNFLDFLTDKDIDNLFKLIGEVIDEYWNTRHN